VEFLGVGYQELLLILVLMLVVVGPERLPGMAYQIGRAVRTLQTYARQVRDEFGDEISYIEEQYKTVKGEVDSTRDSLRQEQLKLNAELRDATEPLRVDPLTSLAPSSGSSNVVSISDGQPVADAAEPGPAGSADVPAPEERTPAAPLVF
jgi:sec-independent protein translocase protein TatB